MAPLARGWQRRYSARKRPTAVRVYMPHQELQGQDVHSGFEAVAPKGVAEEPQGWGAAHGAVALADSAAVRPGVQAPLGFGQGNGKDGRARVFVALPGSQALEGGRVGEHQAVPDGLLRGVQGAEGEPERLLGRIPVAYSSP